MTDVKPCPCNSTKKYICCCGPLLAGEKNASTAEELMRSRYTAYVERNINYLLETWYSATRPAEIDPCAIPEWISLQIIRTEKGGEVDIKGVVEFKATYLSQNKPFLLHEESSFKKEDGVWFYVDGDLKNSPAAMKKNKMGRNALCYCGSGIKFKKCCG